MNKSRYVIISLFVFIIFFLVEYIGHVIILRGSYIENIKLMRTDGVDIMMLNIIAGVIFSFLFCYIFVKGYEGKGLKEGLRFGLVIGSFLWCPKILFEYANFNFPGSWPLIWFIFGVIATIFSGIMCAFIYRPTKKTENVLVK